MGLRYEIFGKVKWDSSERDFVESDETHNNVSGCHQKIGITQKVYTGSYG